MANDRVERHLELLKGLQAEGPSEQGLKELSNALENRVNVVVAKAAAIAGAWQAETLVPDLVQAFARLFLKPAETDPQCWGKNAISRALKDLGFAESGVYLRGLKHEQWESVWGGKSDTAGGLRGVCVLALVQCTDIPRYELLIHLIDALTERDATVRVEAARALEQVGGREVALLLRLKARSGDMEVRVIGQVLESVLQLEAAAGIPFVGSFLPHPSEEIGEEAALALGASRLREAVEVLVKQWLELPLHRNGATLLRAISASRQDAALEFLLEQVRTARQHTAEDVLLALELHRDSEDIVKLVQEAVSGREELAVIFRQRFGSIAT